MLKRRGLLVLSGLVLLSACAGAGAPRDAKGDPLEPLTITTSSGEHRFMVEIADDDAERQRGLMERALSVRRAGATGGREGVFRVVGWMDE